MADPQAGTVKSPIIMKVDSPVDDIEDIEKEDNKNNEKEDLEINPNQICSPSSFLNRSKFGSSPNPFLVKPNFLLGGTLSSPKLSLRPSQLGQSSNKLFTLNPSKLTPAKPNPFAKKDNKDDNCCKNGDAPKFMPLLSTDKSNDVIKPITSSIPPTQTSSSFVFGQNLQERVVADAGEEPIPSTSLSTNGTSNNDMLFSSAIKDAPTTESSAPSKSLSESAREYAEQRANKRKYEEVEVKTGEEDETNVLHLACKLFAYDKAVANWQDRGRGNLRLNDQQIKEDNVTYTQSRLVFRTAGVLRVVLNTKIWADMTVEQASAKSIRFTAIDNSSGEIKVYLVMASPEEIKHLYKYLQDRLVQEQKRQSLKRVRNTNHEETSDSTSTE